MAICKAISQINFVYLPDSRGRTMRDRGLDLTAQLLDRLLGSYTIKIIGVWRSWLARAVWDREVEGSSPLSPTIRYFR